MQVRHLTLMLPPERPWSGWKEGGRSQGSSPQQPHSSCRLGGARASQRQCLVTIAPSQGLLPRCSNQVQVQVQAQVQPVALLLGRIRGCQVGTPLCRAPR